MTNLTIPANRKQMAALARRGEGPSLEFKRHGAVRSVFEERHGFVIVTFETPIAESYGVIALSSRPKLHTDSQLKSRPRSPCSLMKSSFLWKILDKSETPPRLNEKHILGQIDKAVGDPTGRRTIDFSIQGDLNGGPETCRLIGNSGRELCGTKIRYA